MNALALLNRRDELRQARELLTSALTLVEHSSETTPQRIRAAMIALDASAREVRRKLDACDVAALEAARARHAELAKPPPIAEGYRDNFATLQNAFRAGDVCLMSARRNADNAAVALVCVMNRMRDGGAEFIPFAVMVEGNPFELFADPTADVQPVPAGWSEIESGAESVSGPRPFTSAVCDTCGKVFDNVFGSACGVACPGHYVQRCDTQRTDEETGEPWQCAKPVEHDGPCEDA